MSVMENWVCVPKKTHFCFEGSLAFHFPADTLSVAPRTMTVKSIHIWPGFATGQTGAPPTCPHIGVIHCKYSVTLIVLSGVHLYATDVSKSFFGSYLGDANISIYSLYAS